MGLAELSYKLTRCLPRDEQFGLTAQIRRAAVSIPANIAEGYGRDGTASFVQFLRIAQGSLKELETHLLLVRRLQLGQDDQLSPALAECETVGKLLRALIRSLQNKEASGG